MEKILPFNLRKIHSGIDWVMRALAGKKEVREALKCVLYEGNTLVACDGKRLHILKDDELSGVFPEPGLYEIIVAKDNTILRKKEDVKFPNYKQVIPETSKTELKLVIEDDTLSISKAVIILGRLRVDWGINFDYVADLACDKWELTCDVEKSKGYKLTAGNKIAVIMPIDMKVKA
jgi:hypothetical protein